MAFSVCARLPWGAAESAADLFGTSALNPLFETHLCDESAHPHNLLLKRALGVQCVLQTHSRWPCSSLKLPARLRSRPSRRSTRRCRAVLHVATAPAVEGLETAQPQSLPSGGCLPRLLPLLQMLQGSTATALKELAVVLGTRHSHVMMTRQRLTPPCHSRAHNTRVVLARLLPAAAACSAHASAFQPSHLPCRL